MEQLEEMQKQLQTLAEAVKELEHYTKKIAVEFYKSQVRGSTYWNEEKRTFEANVLYEEFKLNNNITFKI